MIGIPTMGNLFLKAIRRLRKESYVKNFQHFEISSSIGANGCGETCIINGSEHISIGKETWIGNDCELTIVGEYIGKHQNANLIIGDHVRIHRGSRITAAASIVLEDHVLIAPEVFITDHNHGMDPRVPDGYSRQPLIIKPVRIGTGTWLGQRVCVMPGVTIGKHCIIGAASVVTHDIPDYCIAVGSPAKVVKRWDEETAAWIRI